MYISRLWGVSGHGSCIKLVEGHWLGLSVFEQGSKDEISMGMITASEFCLVSGGPIAKELSKS